MTEERALASVPRAGIVYRFCAWIAFTIMRLQAWRFDVRGLEHVPAAGGAIITSNHTSFWDYFTVGRPAYYGLDRPVRIMAREDLFRTPVFGRMMRGAQHIPVHRTKGGDALRSAVAALDEGELVLVLPEQTISRSFELLPFKTGAVRMAQASGRPIIPAVSWGTHRFHTVGRKPVPRWRLPVSIRYGEPIHVDPDDDVRVVTAHLRDVMEQLLHEAQASYPDTPSGDDDRWWIPERLGGTAPPKAEMEADYEALKAAWAAGQHRLGPRDLMRERGEG